MQIRPGTVIGERYRVERRLGAGGVGEVWQGVSVEDEHKVAIKKLLPAAAAHAELRTRFKREAELLSRIRSHYVAQVIDFFTDDAYGLVLVMEFIEGEPMNSALRRAPMTIEQAIDVAWDVLGGVADLHREQIVHRDLKPGNVILQKLPNGKNKAVIVDFGMSRIMVQNPQGDETSALTRTGTALGTLEYMAPEQMLNSRDVTGAADIYAVGAMLYRAVAGGHIFGDIVGASLARTKLLNEAPWLVTGRTDPVAQRFEQIVMRMVQHSPEKRHQRAEDVLAELAELRTWGSGHSHSVPDLGSAHPSMTSIPDTNAPLRPPSEAPPPPDPARLSSSPTAASLQTSSYETPQRERGLGIAVVVSSLILAVGIASVTGIFLWKRGLIPVADRANAAPPAPSASLAAPAISTSAPLTTIEPIDPEPEIVDAAPADSAAGARDR